MYNFYSCPYREKYIIIFITNAMKNFGTRLTYSQMKISKAMQ